MEEDLRSCHPPLCSSPALLHRIVGLKLGPLQPTLLGHTHCWKQGQTLPGCGSLLARLCHSFGSRHPIHPVALWSPPRVGRPIPDPASTDSASNQCKGGACHLRVSSDSMPAVSTLGEPQILEDSSRGLQDVRGSRSSRSSCSSAWLRRYMSM